MADKSRKRKLRESAEHDTTPVKKRKLESSGDSLGLRSSGKISSLSDIQKFPVARYCSLEETKKSNNASPVINAQWDAQKLHSALSKEERSDQLLLSNILTGHIVSGKLWPIILDNSSDPLVHKRSMAFMESLANDWSIFKTLTEQEHLFLTVGIRDLWLADSRGLLNKKEKATLNAILDQLEDDLVPSAEHQSLTFSFCPTKNRRVFKLISHLEEKSEIDSLLLQSVAQMKIQLDQSNEEHNEVLYAVWVDPRDLSYHNFEFILPLDRALKHKSKSEDEPLEFKVKHVKPLDDTMQIVRGKLKGADTDLLLQLDNLGLYQKPANSSTRGGERFVFSSSALSTGLTKAIRDSKLLKKLCKGIKYEFQFVNYVFRCNRFTPSDAKFDMHLDTPYYDQTRKHISLYTMIIYLSSGSGKPILKVMNNKKKDRKKVKVKQVDTLEFIVFNQQYKHEGRPFIDNDKIFLRTELIFSYDPHELVHEPEVSKIFSSAIYMTLESSFQPELSKYAHQLYEKINAAHWGLAEESDPPLVLQKCWADQIHFATNGSDYWFPFIHDKSNDAGANKVLSNPQTFIKLAALIATLDYTNAKVKSDQVENDRKKRNRKKEKKNDFNDLFAHFRADCKVNELSRHSKAKSDDTNEWILKHLWTSVNNKEKANDKKLPVVFTTPENAAEILKSELKDYPPADQWKSEKGIWAKEENSNSESSSESCYCPNHCQDFVPHRSGYVRETYDEIVEIGTDRLLNAPVFIYDKQLHFTEDNVTICDDKVFISGIGMELPDINFASCWSDGTSRFVGYDKEFHVPNLAMPPISFVMIDANDKTGTGPGIRLLMDLFKNDWIMPSDNDLKRTVRVPNMEGRYTEWRGYDRHRYL